MSSLKQIEANRLNALKSTGPRTDQGKQRSRQNALRHGLTAETVIGALENAADYQAFATDIALDYQPGTAAERELVSRLASVLWRLRRSTSIETGLFQIEAGLARARGQGIGRPRSVRPPEWEDELDRPANGCAIAPGSDISSGDLDSAQNLAHCFLEVGRRPYGAFDLLTRYETALWRQAAQLLLILHPAARR